MLIFREPGWEQRHYTLIVIKCIFETTLRADEINKEMHNF